MFVLGVVEGAIEEEGETARGENETVAVVGASMTELLSSDGCRSIMLLVAPVEIVVVGKGWLETDLW